MSTVRTVVVRAGATMLLMAVCVLVNVLTRSGVAAESQKAREPFSTTPSETNSFPLQLPVVARPQPQQPAIGLPDDAYLDKTPPRATKGLDLVKSGWTYNCM